MNKLKTLWAGFNPRERWFLTIGGVVVLLIVFYSSVWVPWHDELKSLRKQVPVKRKTLTWMKQEAKKVKPLQAKHTQEKQKKSLPLLTVIEQSAQAAKLRDVIRRMQPGEKNEVKVWLQDAYFDPWLRWIEQLRKQGIEITAVTVSKSQTVDKVNIRMTMERLN